MTSVARKFRQQISSTVDGEEEENFKNAKLRQHTHPISLPLPYILPRPTDHSACTPFPLPPLSVSQAFSDPLTSKRLVRQLFDTVPISSCLARLNRCPNHRWLAAFGKPLGAAIPSKQSAEPHCPNPVQPFTHRRCSQSSPLLDCHLVTPILPSCLPVGDKMGGAKRQTS